MTKNYLAASCGGAAWGLLALAGLLFFVCPAYAQDSTAPRKTKCESTDVVFVIDDTYSLQGAIYDIKQELEKILDKIDEVSGGDFQIGLVTFKDFVEVDEDMNATPDPQTKKEIVRNRIRQLSARAGAAGPEASDEALRTVIFGLAAQGRSQTGDFNGRFTARTRMIVLITDNLPGGFDDTYDENTDYPNAIHMAEAALAADIKISAIYVPTSFFGLLPGVEDLMREYALITGGLFARVDASGQGTAEAIASIIDTCGRRPMV
ncbi:vWA domain-containing protein [Aestuariispira ectoiniformans]|uniref:vWA domain-containing protein n=1 Tax=Aestuariispira ectoiniformans TaxID=2775080 RepID=UPI00223AB591|nr:vWA domain-containing protein [Aestuariispira ectoiniformans]